MKVWPIYTLFEIIRKIFPSQDMFVFLLDKLGKFRLYCIPYFAGG